MLKSSTKNGFFEGWYFKHQSKDQMLALIPGIHVTSNGKKHVFIQIIANDNSYYIPYSMKECYINRIKSIIRIGDTTFTKKGIKIDIKSNELILKGKIRYGNFDPIQYTIMGFFKYIPFMECKHEIISMHHALSGNVLINNKKVNFNNGIGYIEKDMGLSFPVAYKWLHCNYFETQACSVIVSAATIPYAKRSFEGCICVIHYGGKEYRLATYLGVKIIQCNSEMICLKQGKYLFKVLILEYNQTKNNQKENNLTEIEQLKNSQLDNRQFENRIEKQDNNMITSFSHKLYAPKLGDMSRMIHEKHFCKCRFILYKESNVIFDLISNYASLEIVE